MNRIPRARAVAIGVGAALALAAPFVAMDRMTPTARAARPGQEASGTPAPTGGVTLAAIQKAKETARYWTPERIRAAVPADAVQDGQRRTGAVRRQSAARPSHQVDEGVATVGVFLFRSADGSPTPQQFCTASAVTSPTKSLILTAAHCLKSDKPYRDVAFVPGYRAGASGAGQAGETPYGLFPMEPGKVWIDDRYRSSPPSDDVDFAFVRVGPNAQGQLLEDAVGRGNTLTAVPTAQLARREVTVTGYPGGRKTPLQCTNATRAFQRRFMEITCAGFRSGVSGGPFLEDFDGRRGNLVGSIGGYQTGGHRDDVSYSSQFDDDVFRLYRRAAGGAGPDSGNPLGNAGTWQHAASVTAGRFHTASVRRGTSDLVVRWSDGEVSLFPGNGSYRFGRDIQLVKRNDKWRQAKAVTAGDFTGTGTDDLLVRWANGALTLYPDVDETQGLGKEIQLKGPNGTWQHAVGLTAGRFGGGNTRRDDLVVRWSDGEMSLYTDVDGTGLHAEKQLAKRNATWPHAVDLAAGDFGATAGDQALLVRWSDGELTFYDDLAAKGFTAEHRLRPPKSAWRAGSLVTVGAFGGDTRQDDLVARWPGGKLAMNGDTRAGALGAERVLVPPRTG
ncbi:trypsin-like serine peptidase [Streptomyces sp. NPDC056411]|uniref:trypsin-like serine peptidase n=1 Tax=Streptomyces sp. NPDC056411 TaxID=3345813 RepID=UPI0035E124A9